MFVSSQCIMLDHTSLIYSRWWILDFYNFFSVMISTTCIYSQLPEGAFSTPLLRAMHSSATTRCSPMRNIIYIVTIAYIDFLFNLIRYLSLLLVIFRHKVLVYITFYTQNSRLHIDNIHLELKHTLFFHSGNLWDNQKWLFAERLVHWQNIWEL